MRRISRALSCVAALTTILATAGAPLRVAAQDAGTDGVTVPLQAGWGVAETAVKLPGSLHAGIVGPGDASSLIGAGGGLGDVDLLTGSLYGADVRAVGDPAQLAVADMLAADQLAIDAQRLAEQARIEAERRRQAEEARKRLASVRELEGVPAVVVDAANRAAKSAACATPPEVIIGFFKAEAGSYLSRLEPTGLPTTPIRANEPMAGPDTDGGAYDGDASRDWAVGPAQFAAPAWSQFGTDGSGDGAADPQNVYDAAASMANMLCWLAGRRGVSLETDNGIYLVAGDYTNGWGGDWQANDRQAGYARKKLDLVKGVRAELVAAAAPGGTQVTVGPDGCPTSVPANTMRGRAASMDVYELCRRSVAGAPTPEAAQAIKFTFQNLGVPYSQPKRNSQGYFDCSSYIMRAYHSAGLKTYVPGQNAPTTHTLLPHSWGSRPAWSVPITATQAQPGDMIFTRAGHVAMVLVDNLLIHTAATGDVSHVRNVFSTETGFPQYRRVDPSKAR